MNLYFIGLRGSGKTVVSAIVAERLEREYVSTDEMVQTACHKTITEIIRSSGEAEFRRREAAAVRSISKEQNLVVDLGGGAVLDPTSRMLMRQTGSLVWLKGAVPVLWQRIQKDPNTPQTRPGLGSISGLNELHQMNRDRQGIYMTCADFTIDTTKLTPEEVADEVVRWIGDVDICDSLPADLPSEEPGELPPPDSELPAGNGDH
jgi:shikimate kinase